MGAEQAACGQGGWLVPVDGGHEDGVLAEVFKVVVASTVNAKPLV
jgi:hypothetical protein